MGWFSKSEQAARTEPLNMQVQKAGTNQVTRPWPVFWGLHRHSVIYLTDLFNERTRAITERVKTGKSSSSTITTGIEYYGSYAGGVGYGRNLRIKKILKGDVTKWEGSLSAGGASSGTAYWSLPMDSENVPMILYTGNQQEGTVRGGGQMDQELEKHGADHPPYRHLIYFVVDQILFGTTPSPPNFELIFSCINKALVLDPENESGDPDLDDDSYHIVADGQLVPEIIYDLLTNPIYGGGKSSEEFDQDSWRSACNVMRSEGLGYSPKLDKRSNADVLIKELLNFCNGEIYEQRGKQFFRLKRADDVVVSIPETAFLDDPQVTPGGWHDNTVINEVRVTYASEENGLEPQNVIYTDDSSRQIAGRKASEVRFEGIRTEEVASLIANRIAKTFGVPTVKYDAIKLDHTWDFLKKGDLLSPVYPPTGLDGSRLLRVTQVDIAAPGKGGVTIKAEVDRLSLEMESADVAGRFTAEESEPSDIDFQLAYLTDSQKEEFEDGYLCAMARGSVQDDQAIIHQGWDGSTYTAVASTQSYALGLDVHEWRDLGSGRVNVEFSFLNDFEEDEFIDAVTDEVPDWHMLTVSATASSESLYPVWSVVRSGSAIQIIGSGRYIMTLESGQFGGASYSFPSVQPTLRAYLAPYSTFTKVRTNQFNFQRNVANASGDVSRQRRIVAQSGLRGRFQDFADAAEVVYDRTVNQSTPNWGGAASHSFDFTVVGADVSGVAPLLTSLELVGNEAADYSLDWGDGSVIETGSVSSGISAFTHTYQLAGSYGVVMTVTPSAGGAAQVFDGISVVVSL